MPVPRHVHVDPATSGVYHCLSRCVRRAFLCGGDHEHRRDWVRVRLQELAASFALDVCGYAVLNNHFHVILRTRPEQSAQWTAEEVARRWLCVFPPPGQTSGDAESPSVAELAANASRIAVLRDRLSSLSWFMRCLKEPIARRANREDDCTGRFWEGRFRCHRLLDEQAVLAGLVYVDLNVIRAGLAETPEQSDQTSVQDRIRLRQYALGRSRRGRKGRARPPRTLAPELPQGRAPRNAEDGIWLAPIERKRQRIASESRIPNDNARAHRQGLLSLTLDRYLQLVDATGRLARPGKQGTIPDRVRPILDRLDLDVANWCRCMRGVDRFVGNAIGRAASLAQEASRRRQRWVVSAMRI